MLEQPVEGKAEILKTFKYCHEWGELSPRITSIFASGPFAAAEFVVAGRVRQPLDGYPPSVVGAHFEFAEADIFEFNGDGLVKRHVDLRRCGRLRPPDAGFPRIAPAEGLCSTRAPAENPMKRSREGA